MLRVLVRRLLTSLPLLIGVSFLVFMLLELAPSDAAEKSAGFGASQEQIEQMRRDLNLDENLLLRYGRWVGNSIQGDLGTSIAPAGEQVQDMITSRLWVTASLAALALLFGVTAGALAGVVSALRPNGLVDRVVAAGSSVAVASPSFLVGLLLVLFFSVNRDWFPASGYSYLGDGFGEWFRSLVLPALALAGVPAAETARQLRSSMIETLDRDYILTARAKGVPQRRVLLKHALKNAAIAPVTVLGFRVAQMIGGTVVIEQLFLLPGLGQLSVQSVLDSDYPAVLGVTVFTTLVVLVINALVDASYLYFNPKLRTR